jgi:hypothetical protein
MLTPSGMGLGGRIISFSRTTSMSLRSAKRAVAKTVRIAETTMDFINMFTG